MKSTILKRILLGCIAAATAVSVCSCASKPKPDPEAKEIGEKFMAGIEPEMFCPTELDSDWVSVEPHHPTTNGTLTRITYYSSTCEKDRTARVYLPDCYDESKQYPVLYILHGYWGHDNSMAEDEEHHRQDDQGGRVRGDDSSIPGYLRLEDQEQLRRHER